jgi:hypothetical protein
MSLHDPGFEIDELMKHPDIARDHAIGLTNGARSRRSC